MVRLVASSAAWVILVTTLAPLSPLSLAAVTANLGV